MQFRKFADMARAGSYPFAGYAGGKLQRCAKIFQFFSSCEE